MRNHRRFLFSFTLSILTVSYAGNIFAQSDNHSNRRQLFEDWAREQAEDVPSAVGLSSDESGAQAGVDADVLKIAMQATEDVGHLDCDEISYNNNVIGNRKCAVQVSKLFERAGVDISGVPTIRGSYDEAEYVRVNSLVKYFKANGWVEVPAADPIALEHKDRVYRVFPNCPPGSIIHTSQGSPTGRHIGIVGIDGVPVHNSGATGRQTGGSDRCGQLVKWEYPWWGGSAQGSNQSVRCLIKGDVSKHPQRQPIRDPDGLNKAFLDVLKKMEKEQK